jgi:hypothetical protein
MIIIINNDILTIMMITNVMLIIMSFNLSELKFILSLIRYLLILADIYTNTFKHTY